MLKVACIIPIVASGLMASAAFASDCANIVGSWKSKDGALLKIVDYDQETGRINVLFKSPDRLFADGPHQGVGYAGNTDFQVVTPFRPSGNSILSFTAKFPDQSVTTWNGTCSQESGTPKLSTTWLWARPNPDSPIGFTNIGHLDFLPAEREDVMDKFFLR